MKPSRSMIGLASLCVAAVFALWLWPEPAPDETGEGIVAETAGSGTVEGRSSVADNRSEPTPPFSSAELTKSLAGKPETAPLPGFDTPFRDSFDALLEAAEHGDAQAGCRLVAEAQRCSFAKTDLKHAPPSPRQTLMTMRNG